MLAPIALAATLQSAPIELADAQDAARAAITAAMAQDHVPGMALAVHCRGRLAMNQAFGFADLEQRVPATPSTLFRIGSVSKVLTGTLAARLAQGGLIDLDRPIRGYLPEWPARHPPITLRQLLGHLGGIRHYIDRDFDPLAPGGMIDWRVYPDRAAILALFAEDPLVAAPGERFAYSTFGFTLAGLVMEAATGRSYFDLLTEHVLRPAGIGDIHVDDRFRLIDNRSEAYDPVEDYEGIVPAETGPVVNAYTLNSAYKVPGGGLIGNAAALARFGALHVRPGFVDERYHRQLFSTQRTAGGEPTGTGLAWRTGIDSAGRRIFEHSGSQQGSRAYLAVYPDQRLAVSVLSNLGNRPREVAALGQRIAAPFLAAGCGN